MIYFVVGIAGAVGSLLRHSIGVWVHSYGFLSFPLGTLFTNLIGCFALGWFTQWMSDRGNVSPVIRVGIGTGLIGSFTTFSTFSVETVQLLRQGAWLSGAGYVLLSLWGGLLLAWLGMTAASRIGARL